MGKKLDILGQKFGRLTALECLSLRDSQKLVLWRCVCECGKECNVAGAMLKKGNTRSCGCLQREKAARTSRSMATHGRSRSPVYQIWRGMHKRCALPSDPGYVNYGGRGISVCDEWASFDRFYADMGDPPPGMSIDRIENDGNYEPGNCRWATPTQQCNNRRSNVLLTFNDVTQTVSEWARYCGVNRATFDWRLRQGQSVAEAGNIDPHGGIVL